MLELIRSEILSGEFGRLMTLALATRVNNLKMSYQSIFKVRLAVTISITSWFLPEKSHLDLEILCDRSLVIGWFVLSLESVYSTVVDTRFIFPFRSKISHDLINKKFGRWLIGKKVEIHIIVTLNRLYC